MEKEKDTTEVGLLDLVIVMVSTRWLLCQERK